MISRRLLRQARFVAGIAAAVLAVAEAQGGFPCEDDEWVRATWQPGTPAVCTSCYVCSVGQECLRFGGCRNCTEGEVDRDSNPLTLCEECPEGKISQPGQAQCTDPSRLEQTVDIVKDNLGEIVGGAASLLGFILVYCGCKRAEESDAEKAARITAEAMDRQSNRLAGNSPTKPRPDPEDPAEDTALLPDTGDASDAAEASGLAR